MINRCIYRLCTTCRTTTTNCQFQLNYRCTYNRRIRNASTVRNESEECAPCTTSALATTLGTIQLDFRFFVRVDAERGRESESAQNKTTKSTKWKWISLFFLPSMRHRTIEHSSIEQQHICNKIKGRSARAPVHSHSPIAQFNSIVQITSYVCVCVFTCYCAYCVLHQKQRMRQNEEEGNRIVWPSASILFAGDEKLNLNRNEEKLCRSSLAAGAAHFVVFRSIGQPEWCSDTRTYTSYIVQYEILNIYYDYWWKSAPHIPFNRWISIQRGIWLMQNEDDEIKITAMLAVAGSVNRWPYGSRSIGRYWMFAVCSRRASQLRMSGLGLVDLPCPNCTFTSTHCFRFHHFAKNVRKHVRDTRRPTARPKKGKWKMK